MKWTKEQSDAIDLRGRNILVSAAAGSGKTSVLVERIRKMISEEDVPVRSFLVVTFTNAAAAEMKERLRSSLSKELVALDVESKEGREKGRYLRQQLIDLETANISTFHAFGLSIIRRFFYKLDLEPGFRTSDETENALMMEEAMDKLLEDKFNESAEEFLSFMDAYSGDRSNYKVRALIKETYEKLVAMPYGFKWMEDKIDSLETLGENFDDSLAWKLIKTSLLRDYSEAEKNYISAIEVLDNAGLTKHGDMLREVELNYIERALETLEDKGKASLEILRNIYDMVPDSFTATRILAKDEKPLYTEDVKSEFLLFRDSGKKLLDEIKEDFFFVPIDKQIEATVKTAPYLRTLLKLVEEFQENYRDIKRENKVIDFNDIEHYTLTALEDPEVSSYYKTTIKNVFIDEYQDTNLMQEAIIEKIKGDENLFMVGDIKQSIYKFRLAEPSIFQGKYKAFSPYKENENADSIVIDLNQNHRSKGPIIDCINKVFFPLMEGYDERARLYKGLEYDGPLNQEPRLIAVVPSDKVDDETRPVAEGEESFSAMEREATYVASLIKEYVGTNFLDSKMDPPTERPLELKDIVVLRRAITGCQEVYGAVFKEYGIDSIVEGEDGYFDTMEISGILDILRVIDNFKRDISLIGALHSEVFGFTAEDLGLIRLNSKKGSFADAFLKLISDNKNETTIGREIPEGGNNSDKGNSSAEENNAGDSLNEAVRLRIEVVREKALKAYERISTWRDMVRTMDLPQFIWQLLLESGYYTIMGALPFGDQRQANLRALCDTAEKYSSYSGGTLFDFLLYVDSIKRGKVKIPEVRPDSQGENAVRIMTIHKSKGLEFPMVIVSGLGRGIRLGSDSSFKLHKDIGIGIKYVDREGLISQRTLMETLITEKNNEEDLEEEIRILYVAMTRARDRLLMVGHENDLKFLEKAGMGIISKSSYMGMVSPILPCEIATIAPQDETEGEVRPSKKRKDESGSKLTKEKREEILEKLNYEYPHMAARNLKSKYSVSELNREVRESLLNIKESDFVGRKEGKISEVGAEDIPPDKEEFERKRIKERSSAGSGVRGRRFSAAERGTIYHRIIEELSFKSFDSLEGDALYEAVISEINTLVKEGILKGEEVAAIKVNNIVDFFKSEIGRRAISSDTKGLLEKERAFTLKMKRDGEDILVQGIIDCYFKDDENSPAVLMDYKSNWIDMKKPISEEEERLRREYKGQMDIYKTALEKAELGPVSEAYLFLLDAGHGFQI